MIPFFTYVKYIGRVDLLPFLKWIQEPSDNFSRFMCNFIRVVKKEND